MTYLWRPVNASFRRSSLYPVQLQGRREGKGQGEVIDERASLNGLLPYIQHIGVENRGSTTVSLAYVHSASSRNLE